MHSHLSLGYIQTGVETTPTPTVSINLFQPRRCDSHSFFAGLKSSKKGSKATKAQKAKLKQEEEERHRREEGIACVYSPKKQPIKVKEKIMHLLLCFNGGRGGPATGRKRTRTAENDQREERGGAGKARVKGNTTR